MKSRKGVRGRNMLISVSSCPPISCKSSPLAKANNNGIPDDMVHEGQSPWFRARQKIVKPGSWAHQDYTTKMQECQESSQIYYALFTAFISLPYTLYVSGKYLFKEWIPRWKLKKPRLGATNPDFRNQNPGTTSLSIKCCLAVGTNITYIVHQRKSAAVSFRHSKTLCVKLNDSYLETLRT